MKKKTYVLKVQAKSTEILAGFLEEIAGMIQQGYTSGIDTPTIWDLTEVG